jgi:hypothetical protein
VKGLNSHILIIGDISQSGQLLLKELLLHNKLPILLKVPIPDIPNHPSHLPNHLPIILIGLIALLEQSIIMDKFMRLLILLVLNELPTFQFFTFLDGFGLGGGVLAAAGELEGVLRLDRGVRRICAVFITVWLSLSITARRRPGLDRSLEATMLIRFSSRNVGLGYFMSSCSLYCLKLIL